MEFEQLNKSINRERRWNWFGIIWICYLESQVWERTPWWPFTMSWTVWQVPATVTGSAKSTDEAPSSVSFHCDNLSQRNQCCTCTCTNRLNKIAEIILIESYLSLAERKRGRWLLFYLPCPLFAGSCIEEEEGYNEEEMSYVKQGEEALQRAINILSEPDGWTIETVAVSKEMTKQWQDKITAAATSGK